MVVVAGVGLATYLSTLNAGASFLGVYYEVCGNRKQNE